MAFSKLCVSAEGFWLKLTNRGDSLSALSVLCLAVIAVVTFLVFFTSLLHGLHLIITVITREQLATRGIIGSSVRGWVAPLVTARLLSADVLVCLC